MAINYESISMNIISNAGNAKSLAFEAIQFAKKGEFNIAENNIEEANQAIALASQAHFEVITEEGKGQPLNFSVLFIHAEDQLMTTQMIIELSKEIIELYKKINN
ncbi:MAG: PTS lactose/cellobiose transporter subunit IIA [Spiroplasma sp.]